MGLFGGKKQEKRIEELERFKENSEKVFQELLIQKNEMNLVPSQSEEVLDEEKKLLSAYALNLCTISVSQIIDYDDLYIMDQEYEMILNNLNLENMPKDEALLKIFKQILDTITFFKIQDGDKKRLEEKYKQKVKNAIWSAVPNFSVIMTGSKGNPYAAAALAAVQVGSAYMNYRKAKAEIESEHKDEEWQLQRSAIEQLNGLRRELFDTSWRISEKYNFPDKYRLTERQINQYNEILQDSNSSRRFDRLEIIKDNFCAYPPFWYFLANSAFESSKKYIQGKDNNLHEYYLEKAIEYYKEYLKFSDKALLREDNIASACCLEYSSILLEKNDDNKKIEELVDLAYKNAGKSNDVIQTCAISYLGLNVDDKSEKVLLYLFNEGYNRTVNAQILSNIYVRKYIGLYGQKESDDALIHYNVLADRINVDYLCPMPDEKVIDELEKCDNERKNEILRSVLSDYMIKQKNVLAEKYGRVLERYINKYTERFNSVIPLPERKKGYPSYIYLDTEEAREERYVSIKSESSNGKKWDAYVNKLEGSEVYSEYLDILNDMIIGVFKLDLDDPENELLKEKLIESVKVKQPTIEENIKCLSERSSSAKKYDFQQFMQLFNLSLKDLSKPFWMALFGIVSNKIMCANSMSGLNKLEFNLMELCSDEDIPTPEYLYDHVESQRYEYKTIINPEVWGKEVERIKENQEVRKHCKDIVDRYVDKLIKTDLKKPDDAKKIKILTDTNSIKTYLNNDTNRKKIKDVLKPSEVFAVIDDTIKNSNKDLIFTLNQIYVYVAATFGVKAIKCNYDKISFDNNTIKVDETTYKNNYLNYDMLFNMISDLEKELITEESEKTVDNSNSMDKSFIIDINNRGVLCLDGQEAELPKSDGASSSTNGKFYSNTIVMDKEYGKVVFTLREDENVGVSLKAQIVYKWTSVIDDIVKYDFQNTLNEKYIYVDLTSGIRKTGRLLINGEERYLNIENS